MNKERYGTAQEPQKSEGNDGEKQENVRAGEENDGAVTIRGARGNLHVISIIGQIEGHYLLGGGQKSTRYEHLIPAIAEVEESTEIDGLLVILNTMGGDVEAGLALAELIAGMKKPTVSLVLGGGHSIGIPLAVSARQSFIVPSATMTLHPVRTNGMVIDCPQTYRYLERMQNRILRFIATHSRAPMEKMRKMMLAREELSTDLGTVLEGREAVELGLIDRVGGLHDALSALREMHRSDSKAASGESGEKGAEKETAPSCTDDACPI